MEDRNRQLALEAAKSLNSDSVSTLLENADKVYGWLTQVEPGSIIVKNHFQAIKSYIPIMEHFYEPITGWFTFPKMYCDMVNKFPSGSKFIEVGVYEGKSFAYLMVEMNNAGKEFEVTAVDSFTFEDEHTRENILQVFKRNLRPVEGRYKIIEATSWLAADQFEDGTLDFVFLDADHVYESVKKDILAWIPKIAKNGILAGHDLCPEHPGVEQAVNEVFGDDWSKEYADELVWMKQF